MPSRARNNVGEQSSRTQETGIRLPNSRKKFHHERLASGRQGMRNSIELVWIGIFAPALIAASSRRRPLLATTTVALTAVSG
ncbi:MAG: hypothetical protein KDD44_05160 [Bdellovibrionales bacterium]|nr:hypothetical protein [Bdellovibrionales bacterium]